MQYQFWLYNPAPPRRGANCRPIRHRRPVTWTPAAPGNYTISVTAQDGVTGTAVNTTALVYHRQSVHGGHSVSLVACLTASGEHADYLHRAATGGTNVQYQYWLYNPAPARRGASCKPILRRRAVTWTPAPQRQLYDFRDRTGRHRRGGEYAYSGIPSAGPLTAVSVTPSLASPQPPNTPITFTRGGDGRDERAVPVLAVQPGATPAWSQLQAYSSQASYTWTPTAAGNYMFSVTALDATGAAVNTCSGIPSASH